MVDGGQKVAGCVIIRAGFETDGTLGHGRKHDFDRHWRRDLAGETQPIETGAGEERGLGHAFGKLAQSRLDVAAKLDRFHIGPEAEKLRGAAYRRGADHGANR